MCSPFQTHVGVLTLPSRFSFTAGPCFLMPDRRSLSQCSSPGEDYLGPQTEGRESCVSLSVGVVRTGVGTAVCQVGLAAGLVAESAAEVLQSPLV